MLVKGVLGKDKRVVQELEKTFVLAKVKPLKINKTQSKVDISHDLNESSIGFNYEENNSVHEILGSEKASKP